jgi:hypothetical protein
MTPTCPFCGAAEKLKWSDKYWFECGTIAVPDHNRRDQTPQCVAAEVARLTKERDEALTEVARIKAGGCARDQRTTQWCAEAVGLQERVKRLEEAGDAMAADDATMADVVEAWKAAKEAKP